MEFNRDNMSHLLGSDCTDWEADNFAQYLQNKGWELLLSDNVFRAYNRNTGKEMSENIRILMIDEWVSIIYYNGEAAK